MKVSVVILTKNEIVGLRNLIHEIKKFPVDDIFCMDAASTDGTVSFLQEHGIPVYQQKEKGRGRAFVEAVPYAKGDYIIYFSPDGNEDPKDIAILIEKAKETNSDMVIASRFHPFGGVNNCDDDPFFIRHVCNIGVTQLCNLTFGTRTSDAINGLRMIRKSCMQKLTLDAAQHDIEFEITIKMGKAKMSMVDIPTIEGTRIDGNRKGSASTKNMAVYMFTRFLKSLR